MSSLSMNNIYMKTHNNRFLPKSTTTPPPPQQQQQRNFNSSTDRKTEEITENNNQITTNGSNDKKTLAVWTQYNFDTTNLNKSNINIGRYENNLKSWGGATNINNNNNNNNNNNIVDTDIPEGEKETIKMEIDDEDANRGELDMATRALIASTSTSPTNIEEREEVVSPSHHARRPPNAFLIFCKKHRPIVRIKFPNLENRGVTKILGEWWALLDTAEKEPFTQLAKEYKDAFFSANPDFKWYKLPAPPLRTLSIRPSNIAKAPSPMSSSSSSPSPVQQQQHRFQTESEFNLGKLADESQLGSLTSLLNSNYPSSGKLSSSSSISISIYDHESTCNHNNKMIDDERQTMNENNNIIEIEKDHSFHTPINLSKPSLPLAPIKKRIFQKYLDNNNVTKNLLNITATTGETTTNISKNIDDGYNYNNGEVHICHEDKNCGANNMTQQDLLDKVVDNIFTRDEYERDYDERYNNLRSSKETRKSGRQCKGKRYEQFMVEGRLLGNKRDTKLKSQRFSGGTDDKFENDFIKPNLDNTIKRLAERTNMKNLLDDSNNEQYQQNSKLIVEEQSVQNAAVLDISTTQSSKPTNNFNLDLKIENLPTLNYDMYMQRKKESKKRKNRIRSDSSSSVDQTRNINNNKMGKNVKTEQLVGSKKRKNKHSITHLEKKDDDNIMNDLLGLATLAEVAANTQKINEVKDSE